MARHQALHCLTNAGGGGKPPSPLPFLKAVIRVENTRVTPVSIELDGSFTYSLSAGATREFHAPVRFESTAYRSGALYCDSLIIAETTATPPLLHVETYDPAAFVVMAVFVLLGAYLSVVTIKGAF